MSLLTRDQVADNLTKGPQPQAGQRDQKGVAHMTQPNSLDTLGAARRRRRGGGNFR